MRMRLAVAALVVAVCAALVGPSVALGVSGVTTSAPAPSAAATEAVDQTVPLARGPISIQYWMEANPGEAISIVSIELPVSVKLPARVRIPIVETATVQWAGEISGQDVSQDIQRPYEIRQADGGSYVEMVLTTFRAGQIDLSGKPIVADGDRKSVAFDFVQSVDATSTNFSVRVPPLSADVEIAPKPDGVPDKNESGEALYTLPSQALKPGEKLAVTVSWGTEQLAAPAAPEDVAFRNALWVLAAALVGAVVVLVIVAKRRS